MSGDFLCTTEGDIGVQYEFGVESKIQWIHTMYFQFQTDMKQMDFQRTIRSQNVKFSPFPDESFYLQIKKVPPNQFFVGLVRDARKVPNEVPDGGYYFQVSFTLVGLPTETRIICMMPDDKNVVVDFPLDSFKNLRNATDVWMVKCVVWLHELSNLDNERRKEQELVWQEKLQEVEADPIQRSEMASLLRCQTLENIFTGRLPNKIEYSKSVLVLRSLPYLDKLQLMINRQSQRWSEEDVEDLGRLLEYIGNLREGRISNTDCTVLYLIASSCGLGYLNLQCSNYMKMNSMDANLFVNVLASSSMLNDESLMLHALHWFSENKEQVLESNDWINFRICNPELADGFQLLFDMKEKSEDDLRKHLSSLIYIRAKRV